MAKSKVQEWLCGSVLTLASIAAYGQAGTPPPTSGAIQVKLVEPTGWRALLNSVDKNVLALAAFALSLWTLRETHRKDLEGRKEKDTDKLLAIETMLNDLGTDYTFIDTDVMWQRAEAVIAKTIGRDQLTDNEQAVLARVDSTLRFLYICSLVAGPCTPENTVLRPYLYFFAFLDARCRSRPGTAAVSFHMENYLSSFYPGLHSWLKTNETGIMKERGGWGL